MSSRINKLKSDQPVRQKSPVAELSDEVTAGLFDNPKTLPSKYFYDSKGMQLFNQICELEEYYLTRTEMKLIKQYAGDIINFAQPNNIIELGSGSADKIRLFLNACEKQDVNCSYMPIDICAEALEETAQELTQDYKWLEVNTLTSDYDSGFESLQLCDRSNHLVLFMGSTIGNFTRPQAIEFLCQVKKLLKKGDCILIGMDRIKDKEVLHAAYNDKEGVTARFNTNILEVLNRRLGANFEVDNFEHKAVYNEDTSQVRMYLISKKNQCINFEHLNQSLELADGESICTEISHKFSDDEIKLLFQESGFQLTKRYVSDDNYFSLELGSI